jgi:hypothetical protein
LPDQYPDAVHDDALELPQDITVDSPCITTFLLAEIEAVAWDVGALPPPPPPHAESRAKLRMIGILVMSILALSKGVPKSLSGIKVLMKRVRFISLTQGDYLA